MIRLPDLRQLTDYDCGPAVCRTLWRYFGLKPVPVLATPIDGCDPRTLEYALRQSGLRVQSGEMGLADLAFHTRLGRPVVALVQAGDPPVGHYTLVAAVRYNVVWLQDPLLGPAKVRARDFLSRWHDQDRMGFTYRGWGVAVSSDAGIHTSVPSSS